MKSMEECKRKGPTSLPNCKRVMWEQCGARSVTFTELDHQVNGGLDPRFCTKTAAPLTSDAPERGRCAADFLSL